MTDHQFGTLPGPLVRGDRDAAIRAMMAHIGDPGPIVHDDGLGRVWTERFVYGIDEKRNKVVTLPRNPPETTS